MKIGRDELAEPDLSLTVALGGALRVELGVLVGSSASELGMILTEAMLESRQPAWGIPNFAAHTTSSLDVELRKSGRHHSDFRPVIGKLLADGFSWLISNGLVGPASESSGSGSEWVLTTAGREALAKGSAIHVEATRRLHVDLHPDLAVTSRVNFERGDYETAIFAAMKAVEVALRDASGSPNSVYGVDLAKALSKGGSFQLTVDGTSSELEAYVSLFRGAIGAFKNPASHRVVEFKDPVEAADIIHLADLLLRILDRERARRRQPDD